MFKKLNYLTKILEKKAQVLGLGDSTGVTESTAKSMAQKYIGFVDESKAPHAYATLKSILSGEKLSEIDKNYGYLEINRKYREAIPFKDWDSMVKAYESLDNF